MSIEFKEIEGSISYYNKILEKKELLTRFDKWDKEWNHIFKKWKHKSLNEKII